LVGALFAQEPTVDRSSIWLDTVQRGDMPVTVRGRGVLSPNKTADLTIPEDLIKQVQLGQPASVDTGHDIINGKVARIGPAEATIELEGVLPASARPGAAVDGTIYMPTLKDVEYVGRSVSCRLNGEDTIFRVEPDGQHATRVKVHYGRGSVNKVEIRDGLQPGDRVILSDMSAYQEADRMRLQ
jgi:multidrug efflux pump subunit AcrA (membrane-fusion protein)